MEILPLPKNAEDERARARKRMTAKRCGVAGRELNRAVRRIEKLGIPPNRLQRLRQAAALLLNTEARGFPDSDDGRALVAHAVMDSSDFTKIAQVLNAPLVPELENALYRSLGGALERQCDGEPFRFQTQLLVGAMLAMGGCRVGSPQGEGKPDYLLPDDYDEMFSLEVKRPERTTSRKLAEFLSDARDKALPYSKFGAGLAIELSDTLPIETLRQQASLGDGNPHGVAWQDFFATNDRIRDLVWDIDRGRMLRRYHGLSLVWIFARGVRWHLYGRTPWLELFSMSGVSVFSSAKGNYTWWRAQNMRALIERSHTAIGDLSVASGEQRLGRNS